MGKIELGSDHNQHETILQNIWEQKLTLPMCIDI